MNCPYVMRRCKECGEVKFLFKFVKNKNSKYGFSKQCKQCRAECKKKYYEENKEKILGYQKKYREENKENITEYHKKYREENKEKVLKRKKKYREKHKEDIIEYKKKYYETPQGQVTLFNANSKRRNKEQTQGDGITKIQWIEMMEFFEWKCAYSNIYIGGNTNQRIRSIDHMVALDNGGLNEIWNCIPMYKPYNSCKHTSDMLEWYKQQDFYSEERLQKIYEWQEYAYNKWGKENEV